MFRSNPLQLVDLLVVRLRPNTILPRSDNTLRAKIILYRLIEPHLDVIVPVVGSCDLVHDR